MTMSEPDFDLPAYQGWTLKKYEDRPITRRAIWKTTLKYWFRIHILRRPRSKTLYLSDTAPDPDTLNGRYYVFDSSHLELDIDRPRTLTHVVDVYSSFVREAGKVADLEEDA